MDNLTHTESERLDWALSHTGANFDFNWRSNEHWIIWFSESAHYIVRGNSYRECIDNALDRKIERIG